MAWSRGRTRSWATPALLTGATIGVAYTLSPLSVLSLGALAWVMSAVARGLAEGERRWFRVLMAIAVAVRLMAIAVLFMTADPAHPFASFFGDEELYKFRTVWLRNIGQGIPISPSDVIYSYDDVGRTSYMYVMAFVQAIVGDAPYGLHVLNMALYLCGVLGMYWFIRRSYGSAVALAGLMVLLFMPSLAFWSISVLKEPMNVFMLIGDFMCAVAIIRAPRWWQKAAAVAGVVGFGLAMESLRGGGLLTAAVGAVGGTFLAYVMSRGRRLVIALVLAPVVLAFLAMLPAVQERVLGNLRAAAFYHAGHVLTPGYSYQLVNPRYYPERVLLLNEMPPDDAARFAARALTSYFAEPLPWKMESRALLAYLPEQMIWYVLALLLPVGLIAGMKRDVVTTSMLASHGLAAVVLVALTSGNIGTLIRHRALALPYLIWLSMAGGHELIRWFVNHREIAEGSGADARRR